MHFDATEGFSTPTTPLLCRNTKPWGYRDTPTRISMRRRGFPLPPPLHHVETRNGRMLGPPQPHRFAFRHNGGVLHSHHPSTVLKHETAGHHNLPFCISMEGFPLLPPLHCVR